MNAENVSGAALMLAVLILLSRSTIVNWAGALIALAATVAIFRFKISSIWIVLGAGILGYLLHPLVIS